MKCFYIYARICTNSMLTIRPFVYSSLSCVCGSVFIWLFTITVNWPLIWVLFLLSINCYPIWAAIPCDVILHVTLLCATCNVQRCVFIYLLIVIMCHILLCMLLKVFKNVFYSVYNTFPQLILLILFCCYGCCFYVYNVSGDYSACFCDVYHVSSVVVVKVSSPYHCAMGPWSTNFVLNC